MIEMVEKTLNKTKILIIEGFNIKRINLRNSLKNYTEFDVIGVVNNVNDALYNIEIFEPEVVIIDLSYIGSKGIEMIEEIKETAQNCKIIILSKGNDKNEILSSISAGANAYCLQDIEITSLSLIIKTVAKGACWFDPVAVPTLLSSLPNNKKNNTNKALTSPLSEREMEVLKLLVNGKSNTVIAEELIVSVHTAKAHVCNILHKMQVTDRVQAAVKAFQLGLV